MATFMEYLDWRGDLTLQQDSFNEVDNLLLAQLSYVNMDNIAPGWGETPRTIRQVSEDFFEKYTEEDLKKDKSFVRLSPYVMQKMAATQRFGSMLIQNYESKFDLDMEKPLQFAAMEVVVDEDTSFVVYRGTDNLIAGWKEDFQLSSGVVPAELASVEYLEKVAACSERRLLIGGHSKGGNLAVFAGASCSEDVQERIIAIYNNDGPGFTEEFCETAGLKRVEARLHRFIPETSIIGMLLEHTVEPVYVKSCQKGLLQHDAMSWQVLGNRFEYAQELSLAGSVFHETMKSWLGGIDSDTRRQFIDELFSVFEIPGVENLTQLQEGGLKTLKLILKRVDTLRPETKKVAEQLLRIFLSQWTERLPKLLLRRADSELAVCEEKNEKQPEEKQLEEKQPQEKKKREVKVER